MSEIRFRVSVTPIDENDPMDTFYCDIAATEADIQAIDKDRHGFDDFVERFFALAITLLVDRFQQHFDPEDKQQQKMLMAGGVLPRGIEFYREKTEMDKRRLLEAKRAA